MSYAKRTSVPVDRTKAEIERLLQRYGADKFMQGWEERPRRAVIGFRAHDRMLRFELPLPDAKDYKGAEAFAQEERRLWRALLLTIKAKLESVESGIETFEHAFMGNIVLADGRTVAQHVIPKIAESYETGRIPLLLPGGGA